MARLPRFRLLTVLLILIPLGFGFTWLRSYLARRPVSWVRFEPAVLKQSLQDGRIVVVHFQAGWDLNSAVNKQVFADPRVSRWIRDREIVALDADWTEKDPTIKRALRTLNAASIPLIAVYSPSAPQQPVILRDMVTVSDLLGALAFAENDSP